LLSRLNCSFSQHTREITQTESRGTVTRAEKKCNA
jgi:hypothetical protein